MKLRLFSILVSISLASGCASVNVKTNGTPEMTSPPNFEQSYSFWWWGTKGDYTVNVREVCLGKGVEQMQTVSTFEDSLITIVTLGIYSKRTARVWCKD